MNEYGYTQILDILNIIETNFRVKGIDSIEKAYCKKEIEYVFDKETGKIIEKEEFVITTKGSNIHDIFYYEGVDNKRTMSNDVYSIYKIWGIEATRSALIKEINSIYYNNSVDLNFQHLSILVDIMVQTGSVTPVNRYGINKLDTDPLSRASFEKTIEQLIQAAVFQEKDKMNSVSSRIIAGRVINGGTGMMDILVDTYKLENTEYIEDKYLVDISDVHIPSMMEDPFINEMYSV
jgi:DNA-directed RNA polymerase II subunit RPB1